MEWYCISSRDELMTVQFLREAGYVAYAPVERLERIICRRKREIRRPLLVGYVFVHCSDEAFGAVTAIGSARDFVRKTLADGVRVPAIIPTPILRALFLAELFGEFDHTRGDAPFVPAKGDRVRITSGMFTDWLGRVDWVNDKEARIIADKGGSVKVSPTVLRAA